MFEHFPQSRLSHPRPLLIARLDLVPVVAVVARRANLRTANELLVGLRNVLTKTMVSTGGVKGNLLHGNTIWTLGIQKMYVGTLSYKGQL